MMSCLHTVIVANTNKLQHPGGQFGGVSNKSTTDAILTFTHDIEAAWNNNKVTSALTFDIKGYFDYVNHDRLLHEMRRKGIPLQYVRWTASFLEEREAAVCIDGTRGEMKPVENGIPQGSPTSPILAAFYSSFLLELFEEQQKQHQGIPGEDTTCTPVMLIMYVDDGKLYVSSESLETNAPQLPPPSPGCTPAGVLLGTLRRSSEGT
ncbi:unnamed protein product [Mycena citricolor]|uniref:Reverse transcriptase domain-containing protein n=1 Tax=Mycena citricolor TaxID=2018698 RepID=A0AAD2HF23_9AGAR|nr:unnamed protein product [Mycena citricolor]